MSMQWFQITTSWACQAWPGVRYGAREIDQFRKFAAVLRNFYSKNLSICNSRLNFLLKPSQRMSSYRMMLCRSLATEGSVCMAGFVTMWHLIPPQYFPHWPASGLSSQVWPTCLSIEVLSSEVHTYNVVTRKVFSVLEWVLFIIFAGWLLISNKNQKQTRDFRERLIGQICLGRNRRARKTSEPAPGGRPGSKSSGKQLGGQEAQQGQLTTRRACQGKPLPNSAIFIGATLKFFLVGYSWRFWNGLQRSLSVCVYRRSIYRSHFRGFQKPFQVPEEHWRWGLGRKRELLSR